MHVLHRGGYIPQGCDQQGRLDDGQRATPEDLENSAAMARHCVAHDSRAADPHEPRPAREEWLWWWRVWRWPLAILSLMLAAHVWGWWK